MGILEAIIYGIVQGVAEFLPISSSGHLALAQNFFGTSSAEEFFGFNVLLHFGTLIAVFVMYSKDVLNLIKGFFALCARLFNGRCKDKLASHEKLFLMVCAATVILVPAAVFSDYVEELANISWAIGVLLIVNGFMLFVSDKLNKGEHSLENSTVLRTFYIGVFQLFGILPGISRSGSTITGGLLNGLNRKDAVRFSFLMSIPAILGANVLEIFGSEGDFFGGIGVIPCLVGMLAAALSGMLAIKILQFFANKKSFTPFAVYCFIVGAASIIGDVLI